MSQHIVVNISPRPDPLYLGPVVGVHPDREAAEAHVSAAWEHVREEYGEGAICILRIYPRRLLHVTTTRRDDGAGVSQAYRRSPRLQPRPVTAPVDGGADGGPEPSEGE
jgi:hypothetical protein